MDLNKLTGKTITLASLSDDESLLCISFTDNSYIEIAPCGDYEYIYLDIEEYK